MQSIKTLTEELQSKSLDLSPIPENYWRTLEENFDLSPGIYRGNQSAYFVTVGDQECKVSRGIRGINFPCIVRINEDKTQEYVLVDGSVKELLGL